MNRERNPDGRGRDRVVDARLSALEDRTEKNGRHVLMLENTMKAINRREHGIKIHGPCKCGESLLLSEGQVAHCSRCGYQRPI